MRALFDEGLNLDAAARIVALQDELHTARARIAELERLGRIGPTPRTRAGALPGWPRPRYQATSVHCRALDPPAFATEP